LTGELGMRNVLFEDAPEPGVRPGPNWLLLDDGPADPNMEAGPPDGVEGWAMLAESYLVMLGRGVKALWSRPKNLDVWTEIS
jgi:hypothetical protein